MSTAIETPPGQPARPPFPSRVLLIALGGLLLLSAVAMVVAFTLATRAPAFAGNVLDPPRETMDFRLTDQTEQPVQLSAIPQQVVVLTFLYTSCPDVCPLTTARLRQTHQLLGSDASRVAFLAVTVDPGRDTPERALQYSQQHDMLGKWHFLTGDETELAPLWEHYWAGAIPQEAAEAHEEGSSEGPGDASAPQESGEPYLVAHTVPVHVMTGGKIRVVFGEGFSPQDLAHDIQLLLR